MKFLISLVLALCLFVPAFAADIPVNEVAGFVISADPNIGVFFDKGLNLLCPSKLVGEKWEPITCYKDRDGVQNLVSVSQSQGQCQTGIFSMCTVFLRK